MDIDIVTPDEVDDLIEDAKRELSEELKEEILEDIIDGLELHVSTHQLIEGVGFTIDLNFNGDSIGYHEVEIELNPCGEGLTLDIR